MMKEKRILGGRERGGETAKQIRVRTPRCFLVKKCQRKSNEKEDFAPASIRKEEEKVLGRPTTFSVSIKLVP